MQVRRLISILIIFSILMQNVAVPVLSSMMWIQTANASENNFEESDFYKSYSSFDSIEESIFSEFFHHTLKVLAKSDDYENYDARNKLLSFYLLFSKF